MSFQIGGLGRWGVVLGMTGCLVVGAGALSADDGPGRVKFVAQKTQKKGSVAKKTDDAMSKDEMAKDGMAKDATSKAATTDGMLSFKRDIAPILVANCVGCHTGNGAGLRNGKLDMSSFEKLMAGGKRGKDIISGDPDESTLVKMIKGEETPKMPPNNGQRGFSDDAAEKIATWVKQGARLDAGLSATDPMAKYAATLEDLRQAELAKLSPEQRENIAVQIGRERWKKASKVEPEITSTKTGHYLLFSNLPKERTTKLLTAMETQLTTINKFLSTAKAAALNPAERISLYVFKDTNSFVEFVRANENQEVEAGEQARAKLGVDAPYVVAVDPANGGEEAVVTPKKASKKKKGDDGPTGPDRTLAGVLTEQLVIGATNKVGKPPRWVSLGFGAFLASKIDPGSSQYYRSLRKETAENFRLGWVPKANYALGGEATTETTRAIGFGLFEWMAANSSPAVVSRFIQVMLDGQGKLDDAIGNCLYLTREEFLNNSGLWLAEKYDRL
jgi:mono/diheme cytochrome c family protein